MRYRKYAKMPRTRNDGTEYAEVEFVYVLESLIEDHPKLWAVIEQRFLAAVANDTASSD